MQIYFGALLERLRRLFHLKEGRMHHGGMQGAMRDLGNFHTEGFCPTFMPDGPHADAYAAGGPNAPDPWAAALASAASANAGCDQPMSSGLPSQTYAAGSAPHDHCPT